MDGFRRVGDGSARTVLEPVEAALLTQLASQVTGILSTEEADAATDAARRRLLPDAYRDDPGAAAEFRRFTAAELGEQKVRNAQAVIADVADALVAEAAIETVLGRESVGAWLRALTDIRLVLAARLGIDHDGDPGRADDEAFMLGDVYDWLGWVQESLVATMED